MHFKTMGFIAGSRAITLDDNNNFRIRTCLHTKHGCFSETFDVGSIAFMDDWKTEDFLRPVSGAVTPKMRRRQRPNAWADGNAPLPVLLAIDHNLRPGSYEKNSFRRRHGGFCRWCVTSIEGLWLRTHSQLTLNSSPKIVDFNIARVRKPPPTTRNQANQTIDNGTKKTQLMAAIIEPAVPSISKVIEVRVVKPEHRTIIAHIEQ